MAAGGTDRQGVAAGACQSRVAAVARIGEYTSAGQLREYKVRNTTASGLTPHLITVDHNGNIWWSEGFAAAIGELKVAQAVPGTNHGVSEYFLVNDFVNAVKGAADISVNSLRFQTGGLTLTLSGTNNSITTGGIMTVATNGTNTIDGKETIPFFSQDREPFVEGTADCDLRGQVAADIIIADRGQD